MVATSIVISQEYGWNLLIALIMCLQCQFEGMVIGGIRKKVYSKEFFAKQFPDIKNPPNNGYPDMGSGWFSRKLTYNDWLLINNAQRAHYNYLEGLTFAVVSELVAGLFYHKYALYLGLAYIVGRFLYGIGYRTAGPKGRGIGAGIQDIAVFVLFGFACWGTFNAAGGVPGLLKLIPAF